jgi:hypothetical protein
MPENRKSGAKRLLMMFGLFLLCVASAYGYGRWQGAKAVAGQQAEAEAAQNRAANFRASVADGTERAQKWSADLQAQVNMLQARRQLDLALTALDERNFGTAQTRLHAAGNALAGAVQTPPSGADASVLSRLAQELQPVSVPVAEDLAQQRQQIQGWIRDLDKQIADPAEQIVVDSEHGSYGAGALQVAPGSAPAASPTTPPPDGPR